MSHISCFENLQNLGNGKGFKIETKKSSVVYVEAKPDLFNVQ